MIPAKIQRRKASGFVIARSEATWQSRSIRPDHRALPANTVTLRGMASRTPPSTRRVRSAIMPPNLGPARRSGNAATPHTLAFAILTAAGTGRRCLPEIAPQGHFLIHFSVFIHFRAPPLQRTPRQGAKKAPIFRSELHVGVTYLPVQSPAKYCRRK